jgi:hypothetical protein
VRTLSTQENNMAQICISADFFKKERDSAYSNWREAFWRENFQNSLDAGASLITIRMRELENERGVVQVEFFDNGCGMDRATLDEVYFNLGQSTKTSGDTVGGFGRARMLTCFGMRRYAMATRDQRVTGSGSQYEVFEGPFVQGCQLTIDVDDTSEEALREALHAYLLACQPGRCKVLVNEQEWTSWTSRGRFSRELSYVASSDAEPEVFAKVYVTKKAEEPRILVRVGGAAMFSLSTRAKALVVVELDTQTARKVLTSNRDGMTWRYRRILDEFAEELAVNTTSALKPRFSDKSSVFEGAGWILASAFVKEEAALSREAPSSAGSKIADVVALRHERSSSTSLPRESASLDEDREADEERCSLEGQSFVHKLPILRIDVDTDNAAVHRAIPRYDPKNWVWVKGKDGKLVRSGGDIYKIMRAWTLCVREAIKALLRARPNLETFYYGVGWVFSDETQASCVGTDQYKSFLLNPVDAHGNLKFQLSSRDSLKRMMAYAKHEVTHVLERWHDEDYARLLTEVDVHFDERQVVSDVNRQVRGT